MTEQPSKRTIKIELTPEQQQQIRQATGKPAKAVELPLEALEARTTPIIACLVGL